MMPKIQIPKVDEVKVDSQEYKNVQDINSRNEKVAVYNPKAHNDAIKAKLPVTSAEVKTTT